MSQEDAQVEIYKQQTKKQCYHGFWRSNNNTLKICRHYLTLLAVSVNGSSYTDEISNNEEKLQSLTFLSLPLPLARHAFIPSSDLCFPQKLKATLCQQSLAQEASYSSLVHQSCHCREIMVCFQSSDFQILLSKIDYSPYNNVQM